MKALCNGSLSPSGEAMLPFGSTVAPFLPLSWMGFLDFLFVFFPYFCFVVWCVHLCFPCFSLYCLAFFLPPFFPFSSLDHFFCCATLGAYIILQCCARIRIRMRENWPRLPLAVAHAFARALIIIVKKDHRLALDRPSWCNAG